MNRLSIYKRKDGRYEGRIFLGKDTEGKRKYKSFYGSSREEVERKYSRSELSAYHYKYSQTEMTVKELAYEWLSVMKVHIKQSTAANYAMKLRKHIIPAFGHIGCCELRCRDIYAFIERSFHAGLSARYISDILVLLKSIYKYAHREYNIKNITEGIVMPKKSFPEVRLLDDKELRTLERYTTKNPDKTSLGIAISLYTGLRIGELCALKWEDIDLKKRIISVTKTIQRVQSPNGTAKTRLIITEPKSRRSKRDIPIPQRLAKILKGFASGDEIYVLSGSTKPVEPRTMQYRFAAVLKNAGLPSVHFHSLRHLFATRAIALGFDIKTLSELLGHSSVELTLNRYVHSSMEIKRQYMDKMKWSA